MRERVSEVCVCALVCVRVYIVFYVYSIYYYSIYGDIVTIFRVLRLGDF